MRSGVGRCPGLEWAGLSLVWAGLDRTCPQERRKRKAGIGRALKGAYASQLGPRRGVDESLKGRAHTWRSRV